MLAETLELRQTADWLQSELPNHQLSWEKFVASKAAARLTVRERRDLAQSFGSASFSAEVALRAMLRRQCSTCRHQLQSCMQVVQHWDSVFCGT